MPEDWMGRVILTVREFKAELPEDFEQIISVRKMAAGLQWDITDYFNTPGRLHRFYIRENIIYFTGEFSKWWIVRIFQKLRSSFFPAHYELKYVKILIPRTYNLWNV